MRWLICFIFLIKEILTFYVNRLQMINMKCQVLLTSKNETIASTTFFEWRGLEQAAEDV